MTENDSKNLTQSAPALTASEIPVKAAVVLQRLAAAIFEKFSTKIGRSATAVDVFAMPPFRGAADTLNKTDSANDREHTPFVVLNPPRHLGLGGLSDSKLNPAVRISKKTAAFVERPTILVHPAELASREQAARAIYRAIPYAFNPPESGVKTDGSEYITTKTSGWRSDAMLLHLEKDGTLKPDTSIWHGVNAVAAGCGISAEEWTASVAPFAILNITESRAADSGERILCCAEDITLKRRKPGTPPLVSGDPGERHDYFKVPTARVALNLEKRRCIVCDGPLAKVLTKAEQKQLAEDQPPAPPEAAAALQAALKTELAKAPKPKRSKGRIKGTVIRSTAPTAPETVAEAPAAPPQAAN